MAFSVSGPHVVGIAGLGPLGEVVRDYFEQSGALARAVHVQQGTGAALINDADVVFICAPPVYRPRIGLDDSELEATVSALDGSKVIVIMSALQPGMTEAYQSRYPQHCFLVNPPFSRQAHLRDDFLRPDQQIVGYTAQSRHLAESIVSLLPIAAYTQIVPAREAEMTKLMTSTFLALKVIFANEVFDVCSALDVDYEVVREAVAADTRIGASHLDVLGGGYRGYGGAGLPRDVKSLLELGGRLGVPLRVLSTADQVNASFLPPGEAPALQPIPITPDDDNQADERAA